MHLASRKICAHLDIKVPCWGAIWSFAEFALQNMLHAQHFSQASLIASGWSGPCLPQKCDWLGELYEKVLDGAL